MSSAIDQMKKTLETNKTSPQKTKPPVKQAAKKTTAPAKKAVAKQKTHNEKEVADIFNKIPGVTATVVNKNLKTTHDRFAEAAEKAIERELHKTEVSTVPPWEDLPKKPEPMIEKNPETTPNKNPVFQRTPPAQELKKPKYEGRTLGMLGTAFHAVSTTVKR